MMHLLLLTIPRRFSGCSSCVIYSTVLWTQLNAVTYFVNGGPPVFLAASRWSDQKKASSPEIVWLEP